MKIEITVYKDTGKYYTSDIVENEIEIPIYKDEFKDFIINNLPAKYTGGYVVVRNADPNSNEFYEALYKYNDLINYKTVEKPYIKI